MLYVIFTTDNPETQLLRQTHFEAHLKRVKQLEAEGRLVMGGPNPENDNLPPTGFLGSTLIAQFENLATAQEWVAQDPYTLNGVYKSAEVRPFMLRIWSDKILKNL